MCFEDCLLMIEAYEDRDNDQWKHTRQLMYTVYLLTADEKKFVTVYEYMPLKDDPTKAEIAAFKKAQRESKAKGMKARRDAIIERYKGVVPALTANSKGSVPNEK